LSISVILCGGGKTGVAIASGLKPGGGALLLDESLECKREVKDRRMARRELSSLSLDVEAIEARSEILCDVADSLRGNMYDLRRSEAVAVDEPPVHSAGTCHEQESRQSMDRADARTGSAPCSHT
jgi:hypothetical protein